MERRVIGEPPGHERHRLGAELVIPGLPGDLLSRPGRPPLSLKGRSDAVPNVRPNLVRRQEFAQNHLGREGRVLCRGRDVQGVAHGSQVAVSRNPPVGVFRTHQGEEVGHHHPRFHALLQSLAKQEIGRGHSSGVGREVICLEASPALSIWRGRTPNLMKPIAEDENIAVAQASRGDPGRSCPVCGPDRDEIPTPTELMSVHHDHQGKHP